MKRKIPRFKRFAYGTLSLNRIEALSDGIFAFVITLLVLELRVPVLHNVNDVNELAHMLLQQAPKFLSWLISFFIVCKFWLNHHYTLSFARHATYGLVWLNALFLMSQAFIPFPTAMMGEYSTNPLAVSLFGCVLAFSTILLIILHTYIMRALLKPELEGKIDPGNILKAYILPLGYLLGAACAWVNVYFAFALYVITPLFSVVPPGGKDAARS